jgi:HPt (histidine-containing phosphotransfer) domain-containing protein
VSDIQELLGQLRQTYLATLPDKIVNLESLWKAQSLQLLKTEYHKLKGTGRTYGLPEVSQLGEALEHLCEAAPAPVIDKAVQLSLTLLRDISTQRSKGLPLDIENTAGFAEITALLAVVAKTKS